MTRDDDGPVEVTDANFPALLAEGLREARAVARGEAQPVRSASHRPTTPSVGSDGARPMPRPRDRTR
jgi:hypothetical protein